MVNIVKQDFIENTKKYENVKNQLINILNNNISIVHVGSTAIPHMYGKNIIDILVGCRDLQELNIVSKKLENIGYYLSEKSKTDEYNFLSSTNIETTSGDIHIHVSIIGTTRYEDFIILKNYLLNNPIIANDYSNFKKRIVKLKSKERSEYKKIKSQYVSELLKKAKKSKGGIM